MRRLGTLAAPSRTNTTTINASSELRGRHLPCPRQRLRYGFASVVAALDFSSPTTPEDLAAGVKTGGLLFRNITMSNKSGARKAQPKSDEALLIARRARDAERKRRAYWADPEKARAKNRAKRQRKLEQYRARERARYWANVEHNRAQARERARSERGRASNRKAVARYRQRHPEIIFAQKEAQKALRRGELKRPECCEVRDCNQTDGLAMHHSRYDAKSVLKVTTLCRDHHSLLHRRGEALPLKAGSRQKWTRAPRHEARGSAP